MKHFCVIGDPVEHSLSPRLHRRMIELTGLDATYDLCPVRAQELERFVEQARGGAWDGFNVTMPHKEAVVPYLDGLSGTAARCRAVNTVCHGGRPRHRPQHRRGSALSRACAPTALTADKTALIIGTGGAGEAVTDALVQAGARLVYICNRSVYRAQALAARYPEHTRWVYFGTYPVRRGSAQADLVVNATSLGMAGCKEFSDLRFLGGRKPRSHRL